MVQNELAWLRNYKYINLETYKKSGAAVRTPVWFAEDGQLIYIYSLADAGKVKRIRNNPRVRLAPCSMQGELKGEWVEGEARIQGPDGERRGHQLLDKKYGILKKIGNIFSKLGGRQRAVISITLEPQVH